MSTKSNNVKKFINDVGTKNQLFVFVGSNPNDSLSDSTQSGIDVWNNSDFAVKIGQNSLVPVVERVKWVQKSVYESWSSLKENTGNFYAYNDQNGYVYLCISNNENNLVQKGSKNVSNIRPTHTVGSLKYSDGYTWKPLYRITQSLERFLTSKWMPVVSFENFDASSSGTNLQVVQSFCDDSATTEVGKCAIYAKTPLSTDDDSGTIEYAIGDLFTTAASISCSDCHYFMKNNENFVSVFYSNSETVPNSITINDKYTEVGQLIANNQLSMASPYYYLYDVNTNDSVEEGSIVSAFIDISIFTQAQLTVTSANPEFTITSNTGSNGKIKLKTYVNSSGNHIISGVEVTNPGSGYKDITLDINQSILSNSLDKSQLIAAVSVNLDTIDGLAFDPVDVLNAQHVMIDARIEKLTLTNSGILVPDTVNFFGLVENPKGISGSEEVISGSNLNKKTDTIFRTTVKLSVTSPSSSLQPATDEVYNVSYTKGNATKTLTGLKVAGINNITTTTQTSEFKNILYADADDLVGSQLTGGSKSGNTISAVSAKPLFTQYTGKILSTTKLSSSLPISDVDSVIFRINMVKGM